MIGTAYCMAGASGGRGENEAHGGAGPSLKPLCGREGGQVGRGMSIDTPRSRTVASGFPKLSLIDNLYR